MTEQNSFPVRYMPIEYDNDYGVCWEIMDTLHAYSDIVATTYSLQHAHLIAKALNEAEGYVYEP